MTKINITPRTIYPRLGRRRVVYDAEGTIDGVEYYVLGAASKREAAELARMQVAFIGREGQCSGAGLTLRATGVEQFTLSFPHGGSYSFGARSLRDAFLRIATEYQSPEFFTVQAFVSAVLVTGLRGS